jgi:hypothetical protein
MIDKTSSDEMSRLASEVLQEEPMDVSEKRDAERGPTYAELRENYNTLLQKAKSLAGSVLSQSGTSE